MKVLIIANTYVSHLVASGLSFITDGFVHSMIFLREFIMPNETFFNFNKEIMVCDSLEKALDICDQIWIFSDENMSKMSIDRIRKTAEENNKEIIDFKNPWDNRRGSVYRPLPLSTIEKKYNDLPKILIVSIGKWTQLYSVEVFFTQMLIQKNARIALQLSEPTIDFFNQLNGKKLLNKRIILSEAETESNIVLLGHESVALDYTQDGWDDARAVNMLNADIIVLLLDRLWGDIDNSVNIKNQFTNRCGVSPEKILISNFRSLSISESQCEYMTSKKQPNRNKNEYVAIRNSSMIKLFDEIINKITTPRGVTRLNIL